MINPFNTTLVLGNIWLLNHRAKKCQVKKEFAKRKDEKRERVIFLCQPSLTAMTALHHIVSTVSLNFR